MKFENWKFRALVGAIFVALFATLSFAAVGNMKQIPNGEKAKIKGMIKARSGDLVYVTESKSGQDVAIDVTDNTKIERKKAKHTFFAQVRRWTPLPLCRASPSKSRAWAMPKGQLGGQRFPSTPIRSRSK